VPEEETKSFMVEDAELIFRNFKGKELKFNAEGARNFAVILQEDVAEQMARDGWTIKYLQPRDEGDEPRAFVKVKVRFDIRPPRVVLLTSTTRTQLDENSIEILDWADIKTVDLIARGFYWNNNGKEGWTAYLQSMFVTIEEDPLERKYSYYERMGEEEPF
jgi:hypothetical protein